ncbi:tetratricopeptide repeat protein [bacterium]|nr:tetratricopeptide repeat protein [bacterium]
MARRTTANGLTCLLAGLIASVVVLTGLDAHAAQLDEMSLERWAKLREVERYQLNIAEKYYREKNYKVAASEYEKFLSLYETSEGAPYSLLKWSLCMMQQKKVNTAVKEGFQSVIDYWPDSPEAVSSAYFIGQAYKDMGETRKAKKAYEAVVEEHPKELVTVYALVDLADLASIDGDVDSQVAAWKKLTFDVERNRESQNHCVRASQSLAAHCFANSRFTDGVQALATTYEKDQLPGQVLAYARRPISDLTGDSATRSQGEKLADQGIAWAKQQIPGGSTEEETKLAKSCWYVVADLYAASRRPDKVVETYDAIGKKFGTDDETRGRLAGWLKSEKEYDKARIEYAKFENQIEGNNQIAYSFREERKWDQAVAAYQRNLTLDQENQVKWNEQIAATYRDGGKPQEAIAVYDGLRTSDVENAERWMWQIAYTYHHYAGKYKVAIGWYRQCSNFPSNYQQMADCHRRMKEYKEAIILYGQIIGGSEGTAPWALLQIGLTHEDAGEKEKAIQAFQQVCKRFPKDGHASQAHARLQDKYGITVTLGGAKDE